jgi:cyclic pyranopterin phosphate synthase
MDTMRLDKEKLSLHPSLVSSWLSGTMRGPIYVEISPTNRCNHKCIFCACRSVQGTDSIPLAKMKELISSLESCGTRAIMFGGEGEPLLHPDIEEVLNYTANVGVDFAITTNGSMLGAVNTDLLLEAKWIKVSIDAGTQSTYAKLHGSQKCDLNRVLDNISMLRKGRHKTNSTCTIGAQITAVGSNQNEIDILAEKLVGGADYLVVKPFSPSLISENKVPKKRHTNRSLELQVKIANNFLPTILRRNAFDSIGAAPGYVKCHSVPHFWAYIRSNGDVVGCSSHMTSPEFVYGNINTETFESVWEGEKRAQAIKYMLDFGISHCRKACRMNQCNEYLHNVTNPGEHYNFI